VVSTGRSPSSSAPDAAARRLVDALASVPGVPGDVASAAHRLRAEHGADGDVADELARRLIAGVDHDVLASRWVELSRVASTGVVSDTSAAADARDAALAAGAAAVADLVVELRDARRADGEQHTLLARRRGRATDGTPRGWVYEAARVDDGSVRLVRVSDDGRNAPLAPGDTVLFDRLREADPGHDDAGDGGSSHLARGAVGLPTGAELTAAAIAAARRLVLTLALRLGADTPLGALAATLHRAAARDPDPDVDSCEELTRLLRDGALRSATTPSRPARAADAATVAAARRYLARLAGEPRGDALADAAAAFPTVPEAVLADLWPAAGRTDAAEGPSLPSRA